MDKREGLRDIPRRVLDEASRLRRRKKVLELLEQDNHMEEFGADLKGPKRPKFDDDKSKTKKKKKLIARSKSRKTFEILLDEEYQVTKGGEIKPSYFSAVPPPSRIPPRNFCSVCGFRSSYTCVNCGMRFCSIKCNEIHIDTRCMKWVA
ncbi:Zinc finger HIT domain-containing protein 1 [Cichlidogyrus casuarinus]|uniref:Zinc finger HIT domain-containing protein 1 n=1 Tax=Cichlidogyrus casuarinus TaxID=1844966 RepID=A0ABD2QHE0_9PLAT